jgi:hypothetical protein
MGGLGGKRREVKYGTVKRRSVFPVRTFSFSAFSTNPTSAIVLQNRISISLIWFFVMANKKL